MPKIWSRRAEIQARASLWRNGQCHQGEQMRMEGQTMEGRTTSSGLDSPIRTKVAIVTGASRGIGRGIAERLLETGYCVVANSRNIISAKILKPIGRLKLVDGDIGSHNV